ncbi:MAG: putative sulfate exporter family transporter [Pseudomonadaceae bacterium]|nr:putative sulfate exporter family transporter [Pseudomonadaceae bacterium]
MATAPEVNLNSPKQPKQAAVALSWAAIALTLSGALYFMNPAIALLGGLATRLGLQTQPIVRAPSIGTISLQSAIVLLGFTLGFDRMLSVSADYGLLVAGYVLATFALGWVVSRLLFCDRTEAALLTSGTAICGGTAIATLGPLMGANPKQFAVATALVFLLNVVALMTFPFIGQWLEMSQEAFGVWVALAVHDTSSVVATAAIYGEEAAAVATTVKIGRTLWLIPVAFLASLIYREKEAKLRVPLFVVLFILAALVSSFVSLSADVLQLVTTVSKTLLVVALLMIGLEINRATLRQMSWRSVLFGVTLWGIVAPGAFVLLTL